MLPSITSAKLGEGWVRHRRSATKAHSFKYPLFMPLLDLDELENTLKQSRFWSVNQRNIASHHRSDYFGDPKQSLKSCVLDEVEQQLDWRPDGKVLQLAHARYFGHSFNPIALYFCFDQHEQLVACLAEVNNMPWRETTLYAMPVESKPAGKNTPQWNWQHRNAKALHVSPFLPMDMEYRWRVSFSDQQIGVHIENWAADSDGEPAQKAFDATLNLTLKPCNTSQLRRVIWKYPAMTLQVVTAIHWQALKLWLKGVPYIPKPAQINTPIS